MPSTFKTFAMSVWFRLLRTSAVSEKLPIEHGAIHYEPSPVLSV